MNAPLTAPQLVIETQPPLGRAVFATLFSVQATSTIGITGMQAVLPAIAREVGVADVAMVGIFALSSFFWMMTSPYWAHASLRYGQKPMILLGELGLTVSMLLCGLVVLAGLNHLLTPVALFFFMLFARSLFGLVGTAAAPASQAFVAQRTSRSERTRAFALLAGAVGLGTIVGPGMAPLFVLPMVGFSGPLFAFAAMGLAVTLLALVVLPRTPPDVRPGKAPPSQKGLEPHLTWWRDPRVRPFLGFAFLTATCQVMMIQALGFLVIDRLKLTPLQAQGLIAVAMMAGAGGTLLAQWGLIQWLKLKPQQLLRFGPVVAALGAFVVALAPTFPLMAAGHAVACLGFGLARPGFTAGISLAVEPHEQAQAAGAIASTTGSTSMLGPVTSVLLYHLFRPAPYLVAAVVLAGLVVFAVRNGALRRAGDDRAV